MKKNLLTAALVIGVLAPLSAQWTQVGGTVKVKPNTLKYVKGSFEITNGSESNDGNVRVDGPFEVNNTTGTAEFRNEFNSNVSYGQLILKNGVDVDGEIENEFKLTDAFYYHSIAVPFMGYTAQNLVGDAGMGTATFSGYQGPGYDNDRYTNPVWHWITSDFVFNTPAAGDNLDPGEYYEINIKSATAVPTLGGSTPPTTYTGKPNNFSGTYDDVAYYQKTLTGYDVPANSLTNVYGEAYGSYIIDPAATRPSGWDTPKDGILVNNNGTGTGYGNNVYYFSNPYTSNINLYSVLSGLSGFTHIMQPSQNNYEREDGNGTLVTSFTTGMIAGTASALGDRYAFIVRPFHTFIIKMGDLAIGGNVDFNLKNIDKTFEGKADTTDAPHYGNRTASQAKSNTKYYQVGMDLYNSLDNDTGNRFYLVASDVFQPSVNNLEETFNNYLGTQTGVYTLQEKADGTVVEALNDYPVYINGINATDYVGKPVVVGFQTNNGGGVFTLKARFNEDLQNSNHKFYFEDKLTGKVEEVTPDYTYTFTQTETTKERFVMYWDDYTRLAVDDEVELTSETIVYKSLNEFKVRFSKNWRSADVFVYNMLGQLIHSKKGVNTQIDYTLPLNQANVAYIVKTIGDNGEEVTKKVIK